jgi:hypothetical protein
MVASVGSATDVALSGVLASQTQLFAAADNIANATDGTPIVQAGIGSTNVAPPPTGTQPSGAAGPVFDALKAVNTAEPDGGVSSSLASGGSSDLAVNAVAFSQASVSYQANVAVLKAANKTDQTAIDLIS